MKVRSCAHIFEQDVRARPGEVLDLRDALALDFLKRKLVTPYRESRIETAVGAGAPETAVTRRGRTTRRGGPPETS